MTLTESSSRKTHPGPPTPQLILLAFLGFVSLGLPDASIGVAWPALRDTYQVRQPALALLIIMSGLGYLVSSFCYGRIGRTWRIGSVLSASTGLVALAMLGFAFSPCWLIVVLCSCLHGLGSGAIDSGLNGYAATHLPARHLMWLHACYCAGVMLGPLVMSIVFANGQTYQQGYCLIAALLMVLCFTFSVTRHHWAGILSASKTRHSSVGLLTAFRLQIVRLQLLTFLLYTGLEVACSYWTYAILTEYRNVSAVLASSAVAFYWAGLLCGRVLLGIVVDSVGCDRLVRYSLCTAFSGSVLFVVPWLPVPLTLLGVGVMGLGLAPIFPCLMSRTPSRLGPDLTSTAIGMQVASAMLGGAAIPGLLGLTADRWGLGWASCEISLLMMSLLLLHEFLITLPVPASRQASPHGSHTAFVEGPVVVTTASEVLLDH